MVTSIITADCGWETKCVIGKINSQCPIYAFASPIPSFRCLSCIVSVSIGADQRVRQMKVRYRPTSSQNS